MLKYKKSIKRILEDSPIHVSAPHRLELGGTWDVKGFALAYEWIHPCTVNLAINLRTHVTLTPYIENKIKITSADESYEFSLENPDLTNQLSLLSIIACHFGLDGYLATFTYEAPRKAGLGGSGVVAVAFIVALQTAMNKLKNTSQNINKAKIAYLAHCIEESLNFSITGLQDQCAALYGGVNLWHWHYSKKTKFSRKEIVIQDKYKSLEDHIVVAYLKPHYSSDMNKLQVESFLDPQKRKSWFAFNDITQDFAKALVSQNWDEAIACLKYESKFRQNIAPQRIIPPGDKLWQIAEKHGAGFSACGAGSGGCVWALAPNLGKKLLIEEEFRKIVGDENVLKVEIDGTGIIVEENK